MKLLNLILLSFSIIMTNVSFGAVCPTQKQLEEMTEPPFFLSEFLEFKNLKIEQKNRYFVELEKIAGASGKIKIPTTKELRSKSTEECAWEELRYQIHIQCKVLKVDKKTCSQLEKARVDAIRAGQTRP